MKAKDLFMYILGGLIVAAFFCLLALLVFNGIPEQNESLLNIAIGSLLAGFSTVVAYFYGSSKGSSDKTEMINKK